MENTQLVRVVRFTDLKTGSKIKVTKLLKWRCLSKMWPYRIYFCGWEFDLYDTKEIKNHFLAKNSKVDWKKRGHSVDNGVYGSQVIIDRQRFLPYRGEIA
jgi:hypothetical protein